MQGTVVLDWAQQALGQQSTISHKQLTANPWASVFRLSTAEGDFYLKHSAAQYAFEPKLVALIKEQGIVTTPDIIASNETLNCFIASDGGQSLRQACNGQYKIAAVAELLKDYAKLQQQLTNSVASFLDLGLPDWRLSQLPMLVAALFEREDFGRECQLSDADINQLQHAQVGYQQRCDELNSYQIVETLEHSDLQDNNILVKDDALVINDWGDSVVSHPFFSLAILLHSAGKHYGITIADAQGLRLRDTYLAQWQQQYSFEQLVKAFELARAIVAPKILLSFWRIADCAGADIAVYAELMRALVAEYLRLN